MVGPIIYIYHWGTKFAPLKFCNLISQSQNIPRIPSNNLLDVSKQLWQRCLCHEYWQDRMVSLPWSANETHRLSSDVVVFHRLRILVSSLHAMLFLDTNSFTAKDPILCQVYHISRRVGCGICVPYLHSEPHVNSDIPRTPGRLSIFSSLDVNFTFFPLIGPDHIGVSSPLAFVSP